MIDAARTRAAERVEAHALASLTLAAPPAVTAALGLGVVSEAGAIAAFSSTLDVLMFNRVVALGTDVPATEPVLDRFIDAGRSRGVKRMFVHEAPGTEPAELTAWLEGRGAQPYNRWVRHWRRTDTLPDARTSLRLAPIVDDSGASEFGRVVASAFGMPPALAPWLASLVRRPGWHVTGAYDGDTLVGAATMFVLGDDAWLGLGSTLAEYRGRGAQSALVRHRLASAAQLGAEWAVIETAEETPERPVQSYRNIGRLGFTEAYRRQNWLLALG